MNVWKLSSYKIQFPEKKARVSNTCLSSIITSYEASEIISENKSYKNLSPAVTNRGCGI